MRSLALGEGLVELGWKVALASSGAPAAVIKAAEAASIDHHQIGGPSGAGQDAERVVSLRPDLVVVDGYHFDISFYRTLAMLRCAHAVIDDNSETEAVEPILIVNQNPHAQASMYAQFPKATLLLGLRFALLRRAVREIGPGEPQERIRPHVLISIGGSDPLDLTIPIAREVAQMDVDLGVAIGPSNCRGNEIRGMVATIDNASVVDPGAYATELAASDCAIVGAGTTLWEAAYLGVPTIGLIVAENQHSSSRAANLNGFTHTIDGRAPHAEFIAKAALSELMADPLRSSAMIEAGRRSVDGLGARRIGVALAAAMDRGPENG
jgi:UDP-2,4-diacetamido-2,4,6-trideoxy-beta-L-altropyranose hydrolase